MMLNPAHGETRTLEQLREHYEIEKRLANRLKSAPPEYRAQLYSAVYDELFRLVPLHPQNTRKHDAGTSAELISEKMRLLRRFLKPETVFLEIGAGDCSLPLHVARSVRKSYGLDVSQEITKDLVAPGNFSLVLSDGCSVPVPARTVDVAYSYQVMEHVHPGDALEQLRNICRALVPGGIYICITPNRLSGPHDISKYFDSVASGFHLKEYTIRELTALFRAAGFSGVRLYAGFRNRYQFVPVRFAKVLEAVLAALPVEIRRRAAMAPVIRNVLSAAVIGIK